MLYVVCKYVYGPVAFNHNKIWNLELTYYTSIATIVEVLHKMMLFLLLFASK